jgi:hypothetical protein
MSHVPNGEHKGQQTLRSGGSAVNSTTFMFFTGVFQNDLVLFVKQEGVW